MNDIQKALATLINVVEKIDKASADGKFTITEDLGIAIAGIGLIKIFKNIKSLKDEFLALSNDDKTALIAWFNNEFQLRNQATEALVEKIFDALIQLSEGFDLLKAAKVDPSLPGGPVVK